MTQAAARHILVEAEVFCEELKNRIDSGEDFGEVAKEFSSCPSSEKGGDLGVFSPGQMVKEFDEVVFSASINEVQGPIKTQFGFHLIEVTSRTE